MRNQVYAFGARLLQTGIFVLSLCWLIGFRRPALLGASIIHALKHL